MVVCSDGVEALTEKISGVTALIKQKFPHVVATHCMLHGEAVVAKIMDNELNQVLQEVIQVVNFTKARPMKHKLFTLLCNEMGTCFEGLLLHSNMCWLSRRSVLNRVHELWREVAELLSSKKHELADQFTDATRICKLAYISDIFQYLNVLNQSIQGYEAYILRCKTKCMPFPKRSWCEKKQARVGSYRNNLLV